MVHMVLKQTIVIYLLAARPQFYQWPLGSVDRVLARHRHSRDFLFQRHHVQWFFSEFVPPTRGVLSLLIQQLVKGVRRTAYLWIHPDVFVVTRTLGRTVCRPRREHNDVSGKDVDGQAAGPVTRPTPEEQG